MRTRTRDEEEMRDEDGLAFVRRGRKLVVMNDSMTTTTFELPGYRTVKTIGVVRGIMVRSRSIVGNIGAAFQTLVGGNITIYTELCEKARSDAYLLMLRHGQE